MIQRDWLLRLIEQIVELTAKALGLAKRGHHEEARREVERAYVALGLARDLVRQLDASTLRMMAGDKLSALVQLLEADAEITRLAGDEDSAKARERIRALLLTGAR